MTFLFATGIDSSAPALADGKRLDQLDRCGHYARWEQDLSLVRALGVRALVYGPAYYRVHVGPDQYDWEPADEPMRRLRELGIEPIADLCRFSVPSWLGGFEDPAFPVLFAEYARSFARRYQWVRYFTPIHEIFLAASRSALPGRSGEGERGEAGFVRAVRNLCLAHELAVEAILSERPDAVIIQIETLTHFHPAGRAAQPEADRWNQWRHLALDLTLGNELPPGIAGWLNEHGMTSNELSFFRERRAARQRWLGLSYHPRSEQRVTGTRRITAARHGWGFRRLALAYHQRHRLPLFHAGTMQRSRFATSWLKEQWNEVMALRSAGVPVLGFTWESLVDQVDTQDGPRAERLEPNPVGLYDLDRRERPAGHAYRELVQRWSRILDVPEPGRGALVEGREA